MSEFKVKVWMGGKVTKTHNYIIQQFVHPVPTIPYIVTDGVSGG